MNKRQDDIASALPPDLDQLPRLRGFRLRGLEMTRLETFIDAAFAFAVTMMVIATDRVPDDINALLPAFKHVPAFVGSVVVLGIFWRGHWMWSRRYGLEDGVSIFISWGPSGDHPDLYLSIEGDFRVDVLHAERRRDGPASGAAHGSAISSNFAIYATGFTAIAVEIMLLYLRAWRLREPLRLNERERFLTRADIMGWSIPVSIGLIALALALTLPASHVSWSGWIYFSMAILVPAHRWFLARRRRAKA